MLELSKSEALTMAHSLHLKRLERGICSERTASTELVVQWNHTARLCTRSSMRNRRRCWLQDQRTFPKHNSGKVRRLKARLPANRALGSASRLSKRRGKVNSPAVTHEIRLLRPRQSKRLSSVGDTTPFIVIFILLLVLLLFSATTLVLILFLLLYLRIFPFVILSYRCKHWGDRRRRPASLDFPST